MSAVKREPKFDAINASVQAIRRIRRAIVGCALTAVVALFAPPYRLAAADTAIGEANGCTSLRLPIERIGAPPTQYLEFCETNAGQCDLSGPSVIEWTTQTSNLVSKVNRSVNAQVRFVPDQEWQGREEYWSLPLRGCGDCEDFALEKRRRLVESGLPRRAMTMAIVYHRAEWFSHAFLLIETSAGTFVLDNLSDDVRCWDAVPYNYETREGADGRWTRFDQAYWKRE